LVLSTAAALARGKAARPPEQLRPPRLLGL